jgi:hypothetical protein
MLVLQVQRVVLRREVLQLTIFQELKRQRVSFKLFRPVNMQAPIECILNFRQLHSPGGLPAGVLHVKKNDKLILCVVSPCHLNSLSLVFSLSLASFPLWHSSLCISYSLTF